MIHVNKLFNENEMTQFENYFLDCHKILFEKSKSKIKITNIKLFFFFIDFTVKYRKNQTNSMIKQFKQSVKI